ncbi:EF-hand domain-containing protein [Mesorhizobium sp. BAC0120]|uniref:EF-hand domain-containing protein n=1 Tax=Mesorhizobium sp. BAC0120 TaxID=3090670 RepID=UPI00298BFEBB|nr:EF-hand domain-containing protein [Mesorhizobium sp. BAC0120]MDW6024781.1 EF-hand domain-containing protein [Mesorhizobium sp. BAC0120]
MTSIGSLARVAAVLAAILGLGPTSVLAQGGSIQSPAPQGDQSPAQEEMDQQLPQQGMEMMGRGMMGGGMMPPGRMGRMRTHMPSQHMLKILFAIADTNGDGSISFDEISAIQKRIFDLIDTNHDGRITLDELNAFLQE